VTPALFDRAGFIFAGLSFMMNTVPQRGDPYPVL
jgi:hypothetical protein